MISFEHFMKFGNAKDPDARLRTGAEGFLEATNFAAMSVTYSAQTSKAHNVEYGHGYSSEVHDYICQTFVLEDPFYIQARSSAKAHTWDGTTFCQGYAAERWLKPQGFQNGVSSAIVHKDHGELGSVHMNSYDEVISDQQLERLDQFVRFLAAEFVDRRKRAELGLSAREIELVRLIAQGATNPEIAEELYISRSTVRTHVENLLKKFNTENRVGIAVKAARLGIA
ncbi:MAG TPA: response regulator transcription factor [Enteractinococcus sp.]